MQQTRIPVLASYAQTSSWHESMMPGTWCRLGDVAVGRVVIDAMLASKILEKHNTRNRPPVKTQIDLLARDMQAGRFLLSGETLVFDREYRLLNGQNRLHAVVLNGDPVEFLVVCGVDPDVFHVMDQHGKRTASQVMKMMDEANSSTLAGALTYINSFEKTGLVYINGPARQLTIFERLDVLGAHQGSRDSVSGVVGKKNIRIMTSASLASALHYLFGLVDSDLANEFFTNLMDFSVPSSDAWSAVKLLASRLVDNHGSTSKLPPRTVGALTIKAWNFLLAGKTVKVLRFVDGEAFPTISGFEYVGGKPIMPTR